ncbi:hypothetical protein U14_04244 [Candidatus Moduliflexus flocculans]|uniref:Ice-binding protein C-terminal domain-containing protein n=1 Tax=Candidatus Moduliflexus flocculans TaxID=1499966 RepID=A0A0S6W3T6_9BACT|nr:hypothetical protein U14_04244 [Candidatus Moduliflexus flocculans]
MVHVLYTMCKTAAYGWKNIMKKLLTVLLVAASMVILTTSAQALTFSLSEDGTGTNPLLTATFNDISDGVVELILQANLSATAYVTEWFFNLASGIDFNSLTFSGLYGDGVTPSDGYVMQNSPASYGFSFVFATNPVGDAVLNYDYTPLTYTIMGAGLSAEAFNITTAGGEYTRATIADPTAGDGSTYSVTAKGVPVSNVPEPATFLLLGGGLLALVGFSRKLKK